LAELLDSLQTEEPVKQTEQTEPVSEPEEETGEEPKNEPPSVTTSAPSEQPPKATGETKAPSAEHTHQWQVSSTVEATCSAQGKRIYSCGCGQQKEEVLLSPPHSFESKGCGNRTVCRNCGAYGAMSPHQFQKNVCTLCNLTVNAPIFVCNTQLNFDESVSSIIQKLGTPTETLNEGELKSLVFAEDLSTLTVVQTDSVGLWGVFTLDPNAFFYVDGQVVKASGFTGKPDVQSDTSYRDFGSCRVYGFKDKLGTRKYYGLWLRYTECDYHYMTDPRIVGNFATQSRLSYYYVNGLRAINGMAPLKWSDQAAKVSREYSQRMADENFFYHDNLYGSRLNAAGVVWKSCGENVSQGYTSAYFVCDAYYNCADHRNNILSSSFTHVGMGYALQTDGTYPISVLGTQTFYS
ncbi:MAG: CAP domain-containing protein, partial [Clostridia bacterium]|nr:CAP domain-containing protein [Clostridia bacterium]